MKRKYIATIEEEINTKIHQNKKTLEDHNEKLNYLLTLINKLNDNLNDFNKKINTKLEEIDTKEKILNEKLEFIENTLQIDLNFINRKKEPCSYIY
jgi:DNA repair ATPase RecN